MGDIVIELNVEDDSNSTTKFKRRVTNKLLMMEKSLDRKYDPENKFDGGSLQIKTINNRKYRIQRRFNKMNSFGKKSLKKEKKLSNKWKGNSMKLFYR
ncbi:hypothetical protein QQG55_56110 [Brugia pahangi]